MKPNVKMVGDIVSVQNALVTGSVDVIVGGAEFTVSNLMPTNPQLDWVIADTGGLIWNQAWKKARCSSGQATTCRHRAASGSAPGWAAAGWAAAGAAAGMTAAAWAAAGWAATSGARNAIDSRNGDRRAALGLIARFSTLRHNRRPAPALPAPPPPRGAVTPGGRCAAPG
jgi:hypothetical protein